MVSMQFSKLALLGAIFLGFAGTAQARPRIHPAVVTSTCSAEQTLTVVNQANVRPLALATVEYAMVIQSAQLHAAWGTPCVQFGPGGWTVTLGTGAQTNPDGSVSYQIGGHHDYNGQPSAIVETGGMSYQGWARAFTHEVDEMLVDPTLSVRWRFGLVEVCDPVEDLTYPLAGVQVSDFAFPAYFNGGSGPWDQMHALPGPSSFS